MCTFKPHQFCISVLQPMYRLLQHDTAWFWSCPGTTNRNSKYPPQAGSPWAADNNVEEHWPANFLLNEYSMATSIQKPMPATIKNPHSSNPNPRRICLSNNKTTCRSLDCTFKTIECRWCIASHRPTSWQNLIYYYGFRVSSFVQFVYLVFSDSNFTSGIHWRGMNVKIYQIKQESSDKFISQKIMFIQLSMKLDKSCDNECKKGPQTEWQCFSGMHSITKKCSKKNRQKPLCLTCRKKLNEEKTRRTTSFCDWSMSWLGFYPKPQQSRTKNIFIHWIKPCAFEDVSVFSW